MKTKKVILLISAILLGLGLLFLSINLPKNKSVRPNIQTSQNREKKVDLLIDFGGKVIASYSGVYANNAYDVLKHSNQEITVKEYDFGIMINKMGNYKNSPTHAWLYFVNGKTATLAADKYKLQGGDRVEWKYTKI